MLLYYNIEQQRRNDSALLINKHTHTHHHVIFGVLPNLVSNKSMYLMYVERTILFLNR